MADDVKRLSYFKGQFLRDNDFTDEQTYHLQHQRDHAKLLHTPGIASGLDVPVPAAGSSSVTVQAGTAYDDQGRRIVLASNRTVDLSNATTFPANQTVFITIAYDEQPSDSTSETGITGNTRMTERPLVEASLTLPASSTTKLVLARVLRAGGTTVTGVDPSDRLNAGVKGGDLIVSSLTVSSATVAPPSWPFVRTTGANTATLTGNLQITGTLNATGGLAANLVGTNQIANLAVTTAKLADNSVTTAKILDGNITSAKLLDNSVTTNKIADNTVVTSKLGDLNVTNAKLAALAVTEPKLADQSVSTRTLQDNSVTAAKILDGSVGTPELANLAVTAAKIADLNVTTTKIVDGNVTTAKLADGSVITAKIGDASVTTAKLANQSVAFAKLGAQQVVDFAALTVAANTTSTLFTTNAGIPTGGIWFVDIWATSLNASFTWSFQGQSGTGTPPPTFMSVRVTNLTAATLTLSVRTFLLS